MVYRLDAVDAYERRLVKQIEVASATVEDAHNKPYVRLVSVSNKRGGISAKVELDVETATGVQRREVTVQDGDDLEQTTKRAVYADCRVGEIRVAKGDEFMELRVPGGEQYLGPGQACGDVDALAVQREMIRRTIKEHLDKEKRLRPQGIKVLSLFFIDEVARYRQYDADGNPVKGDYARIFEEEYRRLANHPDYRTLFEEVDLSRAAEEVHDGYFSIDKKGEAGATRRRATRASATSAERAYNLIMKEKEKLLSFETPLKFIFSHSALREGWDNPNVFQICALRDIRTERERRQTIGRGLRLCVNQEGQRLRGFEVNTLTVVATESYEQFAENLQKEIEAETGIRFGIVEPHQFAAVTVTAADGDCGAARRRAVEGALGAPEGGRATSTPGARCRTRCKRRSRTAHWSCRRRSRPQREPDRRDPAQARRAAGDQERRRAPPGADRARRSCTARNSRRSGTGSSTRPPIAWSSTTRSWSESCVTGAARRIRRSRRRDCSGARPTSPSARLAWRRPSAKAPQTVVLDETDIELPDVLTDLQDRTQLTRRTIYRVLTGSGRLDDFKRNPQAFIELAAEAINRCKRWRSWTASSTSASATSTTTPRSCSSRRS